MQTPDPIYRSPQTFHRSWHVGRRHQCYKCHMVGGTKIPPCPLPLHSSDTGASQFMGATQKNLLIYLNDMPEDI